MFGLRSLVGGEEADIVAPELEETNVEGEVKDDNITQQQKAEEEGFEGTGRKVRGNN